MASNDSFLMFGLGDMPEPLPSKDILGGKGRNLAEMSKLGLPVPPGAIIPCEYSVKYNNAGGKVPLMLSVMQRVNYVVGDLTSFFGYTPLLSVRSGARVSMPGMMDTILNVGLHAGTLPFWKEKIGDKAALDSYRRLIQMLSSVALGIPLQHFEEALTMTKEEAGVKLDCELDEGQLERLVSRYLKVVEYFGQEFPQDTEGQLKVAIQAVFESWNNPRAKEYRKIHGYSDNWGTAVVLQSMVFGNMGETSATGVVFTRCPSTGKPETTGEFLVNAQGEDVVAGIRTPEPILNMNNWNPEVTLDLVKNLAVLESHYRDMQDVEFTVQDGKLYILQTRNGKRSPLAAFTIARDMANEAVITKEEAVGRVTRQQLLAVMSDSIDPAFKVKPDLTGIAAGGGVVSGKAVFTSADAVNCKEPCILITKETDPDDIAGMNASVGILTSTGGLTSHAAVVARGMNKTCVVGATDLVVEDGYCHTAESPTINQFSKVTIDGGTGHVWFGIDVPLVAGGQSEAVKELLSWVSQSSTERLDLSANMSIESMKAAVASVVASSVYVDTAILEIGQPHQGVWDSMALLGAALSEFEGTEIIVDMASLHEYYDETDRSLVMMCGGSLEFSTQTAIAESKVEAMYGWHQGVLDKVVLRVPKVFPNTTKSIHKLGVPIVGNVATVADLLAACGPVEVSEEVIKNVFGTKEAFENLKKLVEEKTGKSLSGNLAAPVYWYNLLNEAA